MMLFCGMESSLGQTIPEEARRHFDRGMAAVELAKTPVDYEKAITEFEKAKSFAPNWADVYYNLGLVQEKAEKYGDAVTNLKQYLRLAPNAGDAEAVKSHINKLEYKAETVLTISDIVEILVSSGKWQTTDQGCNSPGAFKSLEFITRQGPSSIRVPYDISYGSPFVKEYRILNIDGPVIKFTTKFRNWDLGPGLTELFGEEGHPHEVQIEVVSREHVIVKQKRTDNKGRVQFFSCEYFKK